MQACPICSAPVLVALALLCTSPAPGVQKPNQSDPSQPQKTTIVTGVDRLAGQETSSRIQYVRFILAGSLHSPTDIPAPTPPPTLIAQCTLRPNGKSYFELFANFGGATDLSFYPPWAPTTQQDLFPPHTEKAILTMDFIGYTHVKPVRRQWEIPVQTPGQYRYNSPGSGSSNLEDISYYLRYLLALPTLRLTLNNNSVEFQTTPLLNEIRKEPLCHAAAL
jgi:hypothetical protein